MLPRKASLLFLEKLGLVFKQIFCEFGFFVLYTMASTIRAVLLSPSTPLRINLGRRAQHLFYIPRLDLEKIFSEFMLGKIKCFSKPDLS